ncbi:hypothetical protein [Sphingobacterium psychroaquaticum]|uniref:Uncharacterized protein n=1 Tax=Sphingobacterium psychroaquaticum TaxID=561061 RepID=A0A1X7JMF6_9SPHI|nr:hypothetical protein [Sphingobacterium psychroaquaticum]SMG29406.1 hypothetical protein SAMN05660862_1921 [Sphingobacterium psychroaquaticum]
MTTQQQEMIIGDFERYMRYLTQQQEVFTFDKFIALATSLVNFYEGSNLITIPERVETASLLLKAFNAGIGNRITDSDLTEIAHLIISETTIDYSILNIIFAQQTGD